VKDLVEKGKTLLQNEVFDFDILGFVSKTGKIYKLKTDTKVLSSLFEMLSVDFVEKLANGHTVIEPEKQNYYPDFTIQTPEGNIAIDVKTTYKQKTNGFTLGSYTSFLRNNTKNIVFPYDTYTKHYVLGFIYERDPSGETPYKNVEVFFQEKWKIAGKRPGSGNTKNIGSIKGDIHSFIDPEPVFASHEDFEEYWRQYA